MRTTLLLAALSIVAPAVVTAAPRAHAQQLAPTPSPSPSSVAAKAAALEKASASLSQASKLAYPADAPASHKGEWIELQSWAMGAATRTGALASRMKAATKATPQQRAALLDEAGALVDALEASLAALKPKSSAAKMRSEMSMTVVRNVRA